MADNNVGIEAKYRLGDSKTYNRVLGYLKSNGYQLEAATDESDTYYSRADVDFLQTKECLRIRRTPAYAAGLTYAFLLIWREYWREFGAKAKKYVKLPIWRITQNTR